MSAMRAIAGNLFRETTRSPGFPFYLVGFLLLAYLAPGLASGSDLLARLQITVTYGLGLPVFLMGIATLALSTGSLAHEIERRHVHLLAVKPVPRWHILLGKLLGIVLLNLLFLSLVLGVFAIHLWSLSGEENSEGDKARQRFFTSRVGVHPLAPVVDEERLEEFLDQRLKDLERAGRRADRQQVEAQVRRFLKTRNVRPQDEVILPFAGVHPRRQPGERLLVRFRLHVSLPEVSQAPLRVDTLWKAVGPQGEVRRRSRAVHGSPEVVEFPADVVGPDGTFELVLRNEEPPELDFRLLIDPDDVEVLYVYDDFWPNVARAMLLVVAQLAFLASVGIFGAALFSLPTAGLLCFLVYLVCVASGFLEESLVELLEGQGEAQGIGVARAVAWLGQAVLAALPDFSSQGPLDRLIEGRAVSTTDLARGLAGTLLLRTGVTLLLAAVLWRRRELGEAAT